MLPFEGIKAVSLEQAVAAPFASRQLADLGARVIKIERPGTGDFGRHYDSTVRGGYLANGTMGLQPHLAGQPGQSALTQPPEGEIKPAS